MKLSNAGKKDKEKTIFLEEREAILKKDSKKFFVPMLNF